MVYNVHSSVTRSTVVFFSWSFFAYLRNRIIESGECHNSLNFCTRLQLFGSADSFFVCRFHRCLSLSNGFIVLPRTAKICECCSRPLCSYSAALLEAILQRCAFRTVAVTVLNCCKRQSFCITTFTSTLANWRTKRTAVTRRFQRLNRVIQWFISSNRKTAFSTDKIFDLLFTMSNLFPMIKLITATCALFPSLPALPASWCWSKIDRAGPQLMINQTSGKLTPMQSAVVAIITRFTPQDLNCSITLSLLLCQELEW